MAGRELALLLRRSDDVVGSVGRDHLDAWSPEANGSAEAVLTALLAPERVDAAGFLADVGKGSRSLYAFRCVSCKKRRAHWDRD